MKDYYFEYTKQGVTNALFLGLFAIIIVSTGILGWLFYEYIAFDIFFSIALGVVFFLLNKHHIKKFGKARLSDNELTLELSDVKHVDFSRLKYYYIYDGNKGVVFTLGLLDGSKFKMAVNSNFCDIGPFKAFLEDFGPVLETYNKQNQAGIIHLESILARKNAVYVLLFFTILIIAGYVFTRMPLMCVPIGFTLPLMINWLQYFGLKRANKIVDF